MQRGEGWIPAQSTMCESPLRLNLYSLVIATLLSVQHSSAMLKANSSAKKMATLAQSRRYSALT